MDRCVRGGRVDRRYLTQTDADDVGVVAQLPFDVDVQMVDAQGFRNPPFGSKDAS
jgi:hypothetical protein